MHPNTRDYTYIDPTGNGRMSRIDYILSSRAQARRLKSVSINVAPVPDHKAVLACFNMRDRDRGKGYWKLNVSHLNDMEYKKCIEAVVRETVDKYEHVIPYKSLWDLLKIKVKEESIVYGVKKARKLKANKTALEDKIHKIDNELVNNYTKNKFLERQQIKHTLDSLLHERAKGAQIRSRAQWVEEGERSTSYFLRLEKYRQTNNIINRLETSDGLKLTTDREILEEATHFYSSLYTSTNPSNENIEKYLDDTKFKTVLNEYDRSLCEGKVSLDECTKAVDKLKQNKSPGLDGITAEFYQTFWYCLGTILVKAYNESFNDGILCTSQRISILRMIHKKGNYRPNYRPISITNIDYKIMAFVLAA
jgi:hypothetical protein